MKKVIFFGASVTHQSKGEGYFDYLSALCIQYEYFSIDRLSFPACHLNDAGFLNFKNVIASCPDIVVLEWNTTGLSAFHPGKLEAIILNFIKNNIIPSFLILPRVSTNLNSDRECEIQVFEICKKYNLPFLDLRKLNNLVLCLRDDVHTNEFGAREYANSIHIWMASGFEFDFDFGQQYEIRDLPKVNIIHLENITGKIYNFIDCKFLLAGAMPEIIVVGKVGPYSPIIKVNINDGSSNLEKSIWDPWCYYEREMTISLTEYLNIPQAIGATVNFRIDLIDTLPNYKTCKSDGFEYNDDRFLNIEKFYLVDLELIGDVLFE